MAVTVGERVGTVTEAFSIDLPSVSSIRPQNRATTGSASVTIAGQNFGLADFSAAIRLGHTSCEATLWVGDSSIKCRTPQGIRGTRVISVTAGIQAGTSTEVFSFDIPSLSSLHPTNKASTGSASVTVQGAGFGLVDYSGGARLGLSACEATDWLSDSSVRCRVSSGVRGTRGVSVTVGERVGSVSEAYSFDAATLSVLRVGNRAATGSASVTVQGAGFGLVDYSGGVRVGLSGCEASEWVSDSSVQCRVSSGVRGTRGVSVTVGERVGSVSEAYSFDIPSLSSMKLGNQWAYGAASVTVQGAGFVLVDYSGGARLGLSACEATDWVSDSSVRCRVSSGVRGMRGVSATVGERVGSVSEAYMACYAGL